ncbi:MAG: TIGR02646 family protein [Anaerolineae bacterium]|nr:TIGR02646 family protein [Anaerolineae bacterium]
MRRFHREPAPSELLDNQAKWTQNFLARITEKSPSSTFYWPELNGKRVSEWIRPILEAQTQYHCSYCDGAYMLRDTPSSTIDHFKPKSVFHHLAFDWQNLYVACPNCQNFKREKFDDALLRPDADDFEFSRYFDYDFNKHEIKPHPDATPTNQQRAKVTIELLNLNHPSLRTTRRTEFNARFEAMDKPDFDLNSCNYRYLLDLVEAQELQKSIF